MLIQPYNLSWPNHFVSIATVLSSALRAVPVTIEHVGSTAVPTLASKPIIDIDIVFNKPEQFNLIKHALETLDYFHAGNQGIPGREVFKRNSSVQHKVLDAIAHHLYVCPKDGAELRRHLLFRDALRHSAPFREQYQRIKYALAERAMQNKKRYAQLKETEVRNFIEAVIAQSNYSGM